MPTNIAGERRRAKEGWTGGHREGAERFDLLQGATSDAEPGTQAVPAPSSSFFLFAYFVFLNCLNLFSFFCFIVYVQCVFRPSHFPQLA
jgi:hypothetical protein